jgi:hypothetical protein
MKLIATSLLAIGLFAIPASAANFSGSFGRDTSCQPSNGNWVNDAHKTCPMQGGGSGLNLTPRITEAPAPVPPPECPPKETETPA